MWNTKQEIEFIKTRIEEIKEIIVCNDAEYYKQELVRWTDMLKGYEGE